MILLGQSGPEKHVTNAGLQVLKSLASGGIPVPMGYFLCKEGSFGCKAKEKGMQVVD